MCFIRKALDWVFTQTELKWLDDIMPEVHRREKEDISKQQEEQFKEEVCNKSTKHCLLDFRLGQTQTGLYVRPQKMATGWKMRIYEVEGLYYLCSENKGADQLRSYCAADLRLCFRICKKQVFS